MTMYPSSSTQQPAAICALKSPADAIHILEAVRLGIVPRVTRRLTGHERSMIRPGTVWVWEEEETNMRRWTDGRRWGASRVGGGGFLVYTESSDSLSPPPSRADSPSYGQYYSNGREGSGTTNTPPRRPEPLVKQTYSTSMTHPVTGKIKKFHVVAYSSKRNPQGDGANALPLPHQLPNLVNIKITPGIWPDWETRRDDYGPRRPVAAHGSQPPPPPRSAHGHPPPHAPPPHHLSTRPGTPVTATAVPYPHAEGYRPPSPREPGYALPPGERPPMEPHPAGPPPPDRRYPDPYYDPYNVHRPPYPYDMYPPHDRYPHPDSRYYHPPPPPPGHMPPDYRYDDRYYDRERERAPPPRPEDADYHARYYPPPPHGYYRDPRDMDPRDPRHMVDPRDMPPRDPRDVPPEGPRDPRDVAPRAAPPPHVVDPRMDPREPPPREPVSPRDGRTEAAYPPPPSPYPYPPPSRDGGASREGAYPAHPNGSHLGKRTPEQRPPAETPDPKRAPTWSTAESNGRRPPSDRDSVPPTHARHASGASGGSAREGAEPERGRSRSPSRTYDSNGVTLPSLRDAVGSRSSNGNGTASRPSSSERENWGRVPT